MHAYLNENVARSCKDFERRQNTMAVPFCGTGRCKAAIDEAESLLKAAAGVKTPLGMEEGLAASSAEVKLRRRRRRKVLRRELSGVSVVGVSDMSQRASLQYRRSLKRQRSSSTLCSWSYSYRSAAIPRIRRALAVAMIFLLLMLFRFQQVAAVDSATIVIIKPLQDGQVTVEIYNPENPERNVTPAPATTRSASVPPVQPPVDPPVNPPVNPTITWLPTTGAPAPEPTRHPTLIPTRMPTTRVPTTKPATVSTESPSPKPTTTQPTAVLCEKPTGEPSAQPSEEPSNEPSVQPSYAPSKSPTSTPILTTDEPSSETPSIEPTDRQSEEPTVLPTMEYRTTPPSPTPGPTYRITPIPQPSLLPITNTLEPSAHNIFERTAEPVSAPQDNNAPVAAINEPDRRFVNVTVPIEFAVELLLNRDTQSLDSVAKVWEQSLLDYFSGAFAEHTGVRVLGVDLTLEEQQQKKRMLRRWLQENTVVAQGIGGADFAIDEISLDPESFMARVTSELNTEVLMVNELQQALNDNAASDDITVVSVTSTGEPQPRDSESPTRKPTTAEIVIGFTLLIATLASLIFWARVLWKKRRKRLRRRKLDSLRKMQSVTYQPQRPISSTKLIPQQQQQQMPANTLSSDGSMSSAYPGISTSDANEQEIYQDASDDVSVVSDRFGRELQLAASFDRAAWDEFQRSKKKFMEKEQHLFESATKNSVARESGAATIGIANVSNVSMFDAPGSHDMGMEVEPRTGLPLHGSFPYGDERYNPSTSPVHLTADNAMKWTAKGISLSAVAKRDVGTSVPEVEPFSPYGDGKGRTGRSLKESWDLDEFPVKDESGPSQYSFLYPLKRRELNAEVPDARRSPDSEDSVRESLEVTSVGTPEFADSNVREVWNDYGDTDSKDGSQSALTESMLKEVEDIANYVKQYEQMKEARMSAQRDLERSQHSQRLISVSTESRSIPSVPYEACNDSASGRRVTGYKSADSSRERDGVPPTERSTRPANFRAVVASRSDDSSTGISDAEDDTSQRLGISRISVEKPTAPVLYEKTSQEDPLQFNLSSPFQSSDLVSPFPSSDLDSLRFSPSRSFDKQTTSQIHTASLLDGKLTHRRTLTDDSDDSGLPSATRAEREQTNSLSDLRRSPSMVDNNPSDEVSAQISGDASVLSKKEKKFGFLRGINLRRNEEVPPDVEAERKISPRIRSKDRNFNSIRSIFESKRSPPIVPPSESWQYGGNTPSGSGVGDPLLYEA